ncbi:E7 [Ailuropoda melanoleuca papillomavirus 4]|uniref:Protein E7 n=1 Tax=Ailuropoda melanoleuca papillomavirus 4 TaxID=2016453 RepID=A0A220IGG2_9PAPI|nr:E7 [Ailuropoda melanoleuca papillomavirus 4]ASH99070.1 E7 [Ailuropoda melanoleuca papillomavirus 4]
MIGKQATLCDIVLTEQAEAVDLLCYEQMPSDEEEEQEHRDFYRVAIDCATCKNRLHFVCAANGEDILKLEELLFTLGFLCSSCVKTNRLNHGG